MNKKRTVETEILFRLYSDRLRCSEWTSNGEIKQLRDIHVIICCVPGFVLNSFLNSSKMNKKRIQALVQKVDVVDQKADEKF